MRKSYHICVSGGDEVICRSDADYRHAFNCLALACHESESSLLAESIMSTHSHMCARTDVPKLLVNKFRYSYARYFNNKYRRRGRLGEKMFFVTELDALPPSDSINNVASSLVNFSSLPVKTIVCPSNNWRVSTFSFA